LRAFPDGWGTLIPRRIVFGEQDAGDMPDDLDIGEVCLLLLFGVDLVEWYFNESGDHSDKPSGACISAQWTKPCGRLPERVRLVGDRGDTATAGRRFVAVHGRVSDETVRVLFLVSAG
jgi:hypothetical protein